MSSAMTEAAGVDAPKSKAASAQFRTPGLVTARTVSERLSAEMRPPRQGLHTFPATLRFGIRDEASPRTRWSHIVDRSAAGGDVQPIWMDASTCSRAARSCGVVVGGRCPRRSRGGCRRRRGPTAGAVGLGPCAQKPGGAVDSAGQRPERVPLAFAIVVVGDGELDLFPAYPSTVTSTAAVAASRAGSPTPPRDHQRSDQPAGRAAPIDTRRRRCWRNRRKAPGRCRGLWTDHPSSTAQSTGTVNVTGMFALVARRSFRVPSGGCDGRCWCQSSRLRAVAGG